MLSQLRPLRWASALFLAGAGSAAHAQALPDLLSGRWVVAGAADCRASFTLRLTGDTLRWTDAAGRGDVQQVVSRRDDGIATRTLSSTRGVPVGKTWVYELLAPGQVALTDGEGHSADLQHCVEPILADASPAQFVQALYARYAAEEEAALPLSSPANVDAFFTPDLAAGIKAMAALQGRIPDGCRRTDPFVPPAGEDSYRITDVRVAILPGSAADHATATASFRSRGMPATVTVALVRTASGWRIGDVTYPAGLSFRADVATCTGRR